MGFHIYHSSLLIIVFFNHDKERLRSFLQLSGYLIDEFILVRWLFLVNLIL